MTHLKGVFVRQDDSEACEMLAASKAAITTTKAVV